MQGGFDRIGEVVSRATAVKVRNILSPLLWLSAVTLPTCVTAAIFAKEELWLAVPLLVTGLASPIAGLVAFAFFAVRDPQRLQSEEYLIAQQRLLLEHKGAPPIENIEAVVIAENPEVPPLLEDRTDAIR